MTRFSETLILDQQYVETIHVIIEMNGRLSYIPFCSEHVTYVILVLTLIINRAILFT
jgi:hypothetical protein